MESTGFIQMNKQNSEIGGCLIRGKAMKCVKCECEMIQAELTGNKSKASNNEYVRQSVPYE